MINTLGKLAFNWFVITVATAIFTNGSNWNFTKNEEKWKVNQQNKKKWSPSNYINCELISFLLTFGGKLSICCLSPGAIFGFIKFSWDSKGGRFIRIGATIGDWICSGKSISISFSGLTGSGGFYQKIVGISTILFFNFNKTNLIRMKC